MLQDLVFLCDCISEYSCTNIIVHAIEFALLAKVITVPWMSLLITVSMIAQLITLALIA